MCVPFLRRHTAFADCLGRFRSGYFVNEPEFEGLFRSEIGSRVHLCVEDVAVGPGTFHVKGQHFLAFDFQIGRHTFEVLGVVRAREGILRIIRVVNK